MALESLITTQLRPDARRTLTPAYQMDQTDRTFLDGQVVGLQTHLAQSLIRGVVGTWFRASMNLAVGDIVCASPVAAVENPDTVPVRSVTKATAAAIASAGMALGVVMAPATVGGNVRVAMLGAVGRDITGLAAGLPGLVRVSSTGRPERVAGFTVGDLPLGAVDGFGNLTVQCERAVTAGGGSGGYTTVKNAAGTAQTQRAIIKFIGASTGDVAGETVVTIIDDHGGLGGLLDDDHTQYDLAARPIVAYTGPATGPVLADARKFITTSDGSANTFTIPTNASVAYAIGTLLLGANIGAGTMTLTAAGGVTLNGGVSVPQNGWWWAKKTGTNTWQTFVGGTASSGGHVIENNGTPLTQRANLNVTGLLQASDSGGKTLLHLPNINLSSQVTGALPLTNVAQGTACSFVGRGANSTGDLALITAGTNGFVALRRSNALTTGLLLDENCDPAMGLQGTKVSPNFGSQLIVTTGALRLGTNPATTGLVNIANNAYAKARNVANSADVEVYTVNVFDELVFGGANNAAAIIAAAGAQGFAFDGTVAQIGDDTFQGLEHAFLASTRDVIAFFRAVPLTTSDMPTGSGSGVGNIANATTAPTVKPGDGTTIHGNAALGFMGFGSGGVESVIAPQGSATAKLRKFVGVKKQGDLTTTTTAAGQVIVSLAPADINGAALPSGGVCWVKVKVIARRAYNSAYAYGTEFRALVSFSSSGFASIDADTPTVLGNATDVPTFALAFGSGNLQVVTTPATTDSTKFFAVVEIDGDSDT